MTESSEQKKLEFHQLPEHLQRLLFEIEKARLILMDLSSGIRANPKILKDLQKYNQIKAFIEKNYEGNLKDFANEIIKIFYSRYQKFSDKSFDFIPFQRLIDWGFHQKFLQKKQDPKSIISTGEKKEPLEDITNDLNGGSPSPSPDLAIKEGESAEYKNLSDLPIEMVPGLIQKRKDGFGIWISQVALRHFESMTCELDPHGPIFQKFEKFFKPQYAKNTWATPITNKVRDNLKLFFSLQFNKYGYIRLHLSNKREKDYEKFIQQIFEYFTQFLEVKEVIELLENFLLERFKKPCFIHDAREIGDKKTIDEKFKGAHVKITPITWFGDLKYDVRIDYSMKQKPHIEGEGPVQQVGNLMRLIDGSPEFISNLSEIREVTYRSRDQIHENYSGIGQLSTLLVEKSDQIQTLENSNFDLIQNKVFPKLKETLTEIKDDNSYERAQIRQGLVNLIAQILNLDTNIHNSITTSQNNIEDLVLQTSKDIRIDLSNKIDNLDKNISTRFDNLEKLVYSEFRQVKFRVKNSLYWILQKLDHIPGLTAKEISKELKVSQKSVYSYLKQLQDKNLIISQSTKKAKKPGRPPAIFKLNLKTILKKLKKSD